MSEAPNSEVHERYLQQAIRLAVDSARSGRGGPFGALVVLHGRIVGSGTNQVRTGLDPTAHAEIQSVRNACQRLGTHRLDGALLYASCMPCPMCYAALCWARLDRVIYAASPEQAAAAGFDDLVIADNMQLAPEARQVPCCRLPLNETAEPFRVWESLPERLEY